MFKDDVELVFHGKLLFSKKLCDDLLFFNRKHRDKVFTTDTQTTKAIDSIVGMGDVLLNSPEALYMERVYKEVSKIIGDRKGCLTALGVMVSEYLKYMEDIRVFHELNKNSPIKDKRYSLITDLRRRSIRIIAFIKFRTKPMADGIPARIIEKLLADEDDYIFM